MFEHVWVALPLLCRSKEGLAGIPGLNGSQKEVALLTKEEVQGLLCLKLREEKKVWGNWGVRIVEHIFRLLPSLRLGLLVLGIVAEGYSVVVGTLGWQLWSDEKFWDLLVVPLGAGVTQAAGVLCVNLALTYHRFFRLTE